MIIGRWEAWAIYFYAWVFIFALLMLVKDNSLARKKGWKAYKESSYLLLPKIYNSNFVSVVCYLVLAAVLTSLSLYGGLEGVQQRFTTTLN